MRRCGSGSFCTAIRAPAQQVRLGIALAARGHRVVVCDAPLVAARIRERAPCEELRLPRAWPEVARRYWAREKVRALGVDLVHLNFVRPWRRDAGALEPRQTKPVFETFGKPANVSRRFLDRVAQKLFRRLCGRAASVLVSEARSRAMDVRESCCGGNERPAGAPDDARIPRSIAARLDGERRARRLSGAAAVGGVRTRSGARAARASHPQIGLALERCIVVQGRRFPKPRNQARCSSRLSIYPPSGSTQ